MKLAEVIIIAIIEKTFGNRFKYYEHINESRILFDTEIHRGPFKPDQDIIKLAFDLENDKIEISIDS